MNTPTTRPGLWSLGPARRRVAAITAATLALSVVTVMPAAAAQPSTPTTLAAGPAWPWTGATDDGPFGYYGGETYGGDLYGDDSYGGFGRGPGWYTFQTPATDTTTASTSQATGLVLISAELTNGTAAGTGMVIDESGIVLTNSHVVEGADAITVTIATTGRTYEARVVGTDATHDVAVLRLVGADNLTTVKTDSTVASGDSVTAVGDAGGDGGSLTASPGTVTALDQTITVDNEDGTTKQLSGLIQIDADVIAGDSGGALLDADGEVVGMTTAASTGTPNITGYAVPIATAVQIANQILAASTAAA